MGQGLGITLLTSGRIIFFDKLNKKKLFNHTSFTIFSWISKVQSQVFWHRSICYFSPQIFLNPWCSCPIFFFYNSTFLTIVYIFLLLHWTFPQVYLPNCIFVKHTSFCSSLQLHPSPPPLWLSHSSEFFLETIVWQMRYKLSAFGTFDQLNPVTNLIGFVYSSSNFFIFFFHTFLAHSLPR